jgi:DNA-binding HxlR family transcriptional regulator
MSEIRGTGHTLKELEVISRSGTLAILGVLHNRGETRFKRLVHESGVPQKTLAVRLNELVRLGLVELHVRQDKNGKAYHVYILTGKGLVFVKEIGVRLIQQLVRAKRDLRKIEREVNGKVYAQTHVKGSSSYIGRRDTHSV